MVAVAGGTIIFVYSGIFSNYDEYKTVKGDLTMPSDIKYNAKYSKEPLEIPWVLKVPYNKKVEVTKFSIILDKKLYDNIDIKTSEFGWFSDRDVSIYLSFFSINKDAMIETADSQTWHDDRVVILTKNFTTPFNVFGLENPETRASAKLTLVDKFDEEFPKVSATLIIQTTNGTMSDHVGINSEYVMKEAEATTIPDSYLILEPKLKDRPPSFEDNVLAKLDRIIELLEKQQEWKIQPFDKSLHELCGGNLGETTKIAGSWYYKCTTIKGEK